MVKHSPQASKNKQFFSQQLSKLLSEHNKKQIDLHNDLNIPKSTITGYIKGTSLPTAGNLQKIADYFGVLKSDIDLRFKDESLQIISIYNQLDQQRQKIVYDFAKDQLKDQSEGKKIINLNSKFQDIKVYGAVSAGTGEFLGERTPELVTVNFIPPKHDFALRVNGDSMKPLFEDGQIIFVNKVKDDSLIRSNQIVIAELNGDAYVKKIVFERVGCRLVSLNKKYKDIVVKENDDFSVRGLVIL